MIQKNNNKKITTKKDDNIFQLYFDLSREKELDADNAIDLTKWLQLKELLS